MEINVERGFGIKVKRVDVNGEKGSRVALLIPVGSSGETVDLVEKVPSRSLRDVNRAVSALQTSAMGLQEGEKRALRVSFDYGTEEGMKVHVLERRSGLMGFFKAGSVKERVIPCQDLAIAANVLSGIIGNGEGDVTRVRSDLGHRRGTVNTFVVVEGEGGRVSIKKYVDSKE